MALDALRDVLLQVSGNYARQAQEDRMHARDRQEHLADVESQRQFIREQNEDADTRAMKMAEFNSKLGIQTKLEQLKELAPAEYESNLRLTARSLNMPNADKAPIAEIEAAMNSLKDKQAAVEAIRTTAANIAAAKATLPDRQDIDRQQNTPAAKAALGQYQQLQAQLAEVRKAIPDLNGPMTAGEIAESKVQDLLKGLRALPVEQANKTIRSYISLPGGLNPKKATLAEFTAALSLPSAREKFALENSLVNDNDIRAANARANAALRGESVVTARLVGGLMDQINSVGKQLMELKVDPNYSWEEQPYYSKSGLPTVTADPSPATQAKLASVFLTPPSSFPMSGATYRGTPAAAPGGGAASFLAPHSVYNPSVRDVMGGTPDTPAPVPTPAPVTPAPAEAAPAAAPMAPSYSLLGLLQRAPSVLPSPVDVVAAPGKLIDETGRYLGAGVQGLWNGNYTPADKGLVTMAGEKLGDAVSPFFSPRTWTPPAEAPASATAPVPSTPVQYPLVPNYSGGSRPMTSDEQAAYDYQQQLQRSGASSFWSR